MLYNGVSSSRSNSPESDDNSGNSNADNNNLVDIMVRRIRGSSCNPVICLYV